MDDCANLNLLAVTQCGVRLFFTTSSLNTAQMTQVNRSPQTVQSAMSQSSSIKSPTEACNPQSPTQTGMHMSSSLEQKQQGLYLLHVRLPPGYTPNTTINKPKQVHTAHYNEGTLLLVSTPQQDQDILWSISSSPFPNRTYLTESTTIIPLDGIVWSLAEMSSPCSARLQSILRKAQKPKKVVLLTNQGAHIIALLKPIDILQQLLLSCHGPHHEAVKAFFQVCCIFFIDVIIDKIYVYCACIFRHKVTEKHAALHCS